MDNIGKRFQLEKQVDQKRVDQILTRAKWESSTKDVLTFGLKNFWLPLVMLFTVGWKIVNDKRALSKGVAHE